MVRVAAPSNTGSVDADRSRMSDQDLLVAISHGLTAVYTDVLRLPIPDGVAAVLNRLESSLSSNTPVGFHDHSQTRRTPSCFGFSRTSSRTA